MKQKITSSERERLILRYKSGESAKKLYTEVGISKSTFYGYVKKHSDSTSQKSNPSNLHLSNVRLSKLQQILEVKDKVNCTVSSPLKEKLYELEKLQSQYSVYILCEALKVDRGTYYNHINRNKKHEAWFHKHRTEMKVLVQEVYDEFHQIYGAAKISYILKDRGVATSPEYVRSIMKELGIKSMSITAKKDYELLNKKNKIDKLNKNFSTTSPNMVWVSDTTSFKIQGTWYYICAIIDLYSRKVISYKISKKHTSNLISGSFKLAMADRSIEGLTFHSDRGAQYTSLAFMKLLKSLNVTQSFSPSGSPYNNSVMEAFFSILKKEEIYRIDYQSFEQFKRRIAQYIDLYNNERPHSYLKYQTPNAFEEKYYQKLNSLVQKWHFLIQKHFHFSAKWFLTYKHKKSEFT